MAEPVFFDRSSAERIANAVRKVEIGDRSEAALRFRRELPQQQRKVFRIATFTGAWSIGTIKSVTLKDTTATVAAVNLFRTLPDPLVADEIAIARDGTAWYLIQWEQPTAATATVSVVTDASLTTAGLEFTRNSIVTLGSSTVVNSVISVSSCPAQASATQLSAFFG